MNLHSTINEFMDQKNRTLQTKNFVSQKTVIRTKDYDASKKFYLQILKLEIVEEYNDEDGVRGCIFKIGDSGAHVEISEIGNEHNYFQDSFAHDFKGDKIDIQIRTNDVFYWATILNKNWEARGPVLRPWGSYYLYLRDPDGLQIIIYQEKENK